MTDRRRFLGSLVALAIAPTLAKAKPFALEEWALNADNFIGAFPYAVGDLIKCSGFAGSMNGMFRVTSVAPDGGTLTRLQ